MSPRDGNHAVAGEYLAYYDETTRDDGSRCGYSDSELSAIRVQLRKRGLALIADDRGLLVIAQEHTT